MKNRCRCVCHGEAGGPWPCECGERHLPLQVLSSEEIDAMQFDGVDDWLTSRYAPKGGNGMSPEDKDEVRQYIHQLVRDETLYLHNGIVDIRKELARIGVRLLGLLLLFVSFALGVIFAELLRVIR